LVICNVAISLTTVFIISFLPFLCIILLSLFFCFNKYFLFLLVFFKRMALVLLMHEWRYENMRSEDGDILWAELLDISCGLNLLEVSCGLIYWRYLVG